MSQWITDAQFAKDIDEGSIIVSNQKIGKFLRRSNYDQFIIVASKGMGKTLLLRYKRKLIEKHDPSILLIPKNETSDYVSLTTSLKREVIELMDEAVFWEDLWKLAIAISALINFPHSISDDEKRVIKIELGRSGLPVPIVSELLDAFENKHVFPRSPSGVLDIILQTGRKTIERLRSSSVQIVMQLFNKYISSGCFVFIDSFDQALNRVFSNNLAVWCAAQCGLLKAAWELSRHNRHSKVFVTVRQEAY